MYLYHWLHISIVTMPCCWSTMQIRGSKICESSTQFSASSSNSTADGDPIEFNWLHLFEMLVALRKMVSFIPAINMCLISGVWLHLFGLYCTFKWPQARFSCSLISLNLQYNHIFENFTPIWNLSSAFKWIYINPYCKESSRKMQDQHLSEVLCQKHILNMHVFWCVRKLEHPEEIHIRTGRTRKPTEKGPGGVWTQVFPTVRQQSKPLIRQHAIKCLKI